MYDSIDNWFYSLCEKDFSTEGKKMACKILGFPNIQYSNSTRVTFENSTLKRFFCNFSKSFLSCDFEKQKKDSCHDVSNLYCAGKLNLKKKLLII